MHQEMSCNTGFFELGIGALYDNMSNVVLALCGKY